jgi:hypothetical protein
MLKQHDLLDEAEALDSVELDYPEEPLAVLQQLHSQYPDAGPPITRSMLKELDEELDRWQSEVDQAECWARELERRVQRGDPHADLAAAQQARNKANEVATTPEPRGFAQCMNKSRMFFHSDKRGHDQTTDREQQSTQFSQVNAAWNCLHSCRSLFKQLRTFRAEFAQAAHDTGSSDSEA